MRLINITALLFAPLALAAPYPIEVTKRVCIHERFEGTAN